MATWRRDYIDRSKLLTKYLSLRTGAPTRGIVLHRYHAVNGLLHAYLTSPLHCPLAHGHSDEGHRHIYKLISVERREW